MAPIRWATAALLAVLATVAGDASAQDAERGARLFANTRGETGRPVGNCVACHANIGALREMIRNRGGKVDSARSIFSLLRKVTRLAPLSRRASRTRSKVS